MYNEGGNDLLDQNSQSSKHISTYIILQNTPFVSNVSNVFQIFLEGFKNKCQKGPSQRNQHHLYGFLYKFLWLLVKSKDYSSLLT